MIRTRTNHLLGPIHKDKLLELIENGSVTSDDEICSGNGYWFYLRESELLNRYVYSETPQEFNPVSEALNEHNIREKGEHPIAPKKSRPASIEQGEPKRNEAGEIITQVIPISTIQEDSSEPSGENNYNHQKKK